MQHCEGTAGNAKHASARSNVVAAGNRNEPHGRSWRQLWRRSVPGRWLWLRATRVSLLGSRARRVDATAVGLTGVVVEAVRAVHDELIRREASYVTRDRTRPSCRRVAGGWGTGGVSSAQPRLVQRGRVDSPLPANVRAQLIPSLPHHDGGILSVGEAVVGVLMSEVCSSAQASAGQLGRLAHLSKRAPLTNVDVLLWTRAHVSIAEVQRVRGRNRTL